MPPTCQPLPRSVAEEMLQVVARAICDRPGDSPAQRESRTSQMVHASVGLEPRDGLEYMLSTLVFAHFNLILDSMHDVFQGQMDSMQAKTKTTIVALDRSMIALVKELRESRKRPLAKWAEDARRAEMAAAEAGTASPPADARTPDEPMPQPCEIVPETGIPAEPTPTPAPARSAAPRSARVVPLRTQDPIPLTPARHGVAGAATPPPPDDDTFEEHVAAFQDALAAMEETLAEARALDGAKKEAASGD